MIEGLHFEGKIHNEKNFTKAAVDTVWSPQTAAVTKAILFCPIHPGVNICQPKQTGIFQRKGVNVRDCHVCLAEEDRKKKESDNSIKLANSQKAEIQILKQQLEHAQNKNLEYVERSLSNKVDRFDHMFKVLVIGDCGVGKSSILLQFTDGQFNLNTLSSIGVDFKVKIMDALASDGTTRRVKVTIWDTAGQERFRTLTNSYYRSAHGIVLVYDVARRDSFDNLNIWLKEIEQFSVNNGRDVAKLLVGNKIDQPRVIQRQEAEEWAKQRDMLYMESSAKTNEGIVQVFNDVVKKILDNPVLLHNSRSDQSGNKLNGDNNKSQKSKGWGWC